MCAILDPHILKLYKFSILVEFMMFGRVCFDKMNKNLKWKSAPIKFCDSASKIRLQILSSWPVQSMIEHHKKYMQWKHLADLSNFF